jgi:hypothetical protein
MMTDIHTWVVMSDASNLIASTNNQEEAAEWEKEIVSGEWGLCCILTFDADGNPIDLVAESPKPKTTRRPEDNPSSMRVVLRIDSWEPECDVSPQELADYLHDAIIARKNRSDGEDVYVEIEEVLS